MKRAEALEVLNSMPMEELSSACDSLREKAFGGRVSLCSIFNAKNGACGENCAFCAQSGSPGSGTATPEEMHSALKAASEAGAERFSLVTSGRALGGKDLETVLGIGKQTDGSCSLCASLGILGRDELARVKQAGFTRYHHNLETSRDFFPAVCTSHTWEDRANTVSMAAEAGLSVCSGGIIGMGETDLHRVQLAEELKSLQVDSIALNFFIPVQGSRLKPAKLSPEKMLRVTGMFRMMNPAAEVRICAGRNLLGNRMKDVFRFGASGMMTGRLLTTPGSGTDEDKLIVKKAGLTT